MSSDLTLGGEVRPPEMGRRERKKLQTRHALQAAGLRLFAERGYDETTIQDITDAADVSPRTFFLHFASKEAVLLGEEKARLQAFVAEFQARPEQESPRTALRHALANLVHLGPEDREPAMLRARLLEEAPGLLAGDLEGAIDVERRLAREIARRTGLDARRDLYPSLLAAAAGTGLRVGFTLWYHRGGEGTPSVLVIEAYDVATAALDAPPVPPGA